MSNENLPAEQPPKGEFLLYQTEDGQTRIECRLQHESIWLSQKEIAELFMVSVKTINEHLVNIYGERELPAEATVRKFQLVQTEGTRQVSREIAHYNLDAIISVGYRVRSHRGTQFRIWATERLREYLVKGFAMDDARLKQAGGGQYFEELLARIRDVRSSKRVFWKKVLDIYATSIDYDPAVETSTLFFKTVQNKMHWASHGHTANATYFGIHCVSGSALAAGFCRENVARSYRWLAPFRSVRCKVSGIGHTAAEIVHERTDASQPNMGLASWSGEKPRKTDVAIAKNYLHAEEIEALNRIVTAYLEFAELQALNQNPMTMEGWITKLDDFLKLSDRDVLSHAGRISHEQAKEKAESQYNTFKQHQAALPKPVDEQFEQSLDELKRIEKENKEDKEESE